ncbi:hypothetical protein [Bacillus atrophaeus]|uniref:hypothetical protein n=1 Tax=Bacillus atrophaeus TaxID=1452 RepID=UPI0022801B2A|nr:hypothetical protein [Bacillus atrophaeus]MCY8916270.1 hypothetical protein [Bacillus atrophaeus]MCY8926428.1 hypothetical protein [Bacillus atrophaeus]MED4846202.1 hypothetical protein [Bacillus atrophaeus]
MQNHSLMETKEISKYLGKRYGEPYKENLTIQQIVKEALKRDHSEEQLKLMVNRLDSNLSVSNDLSSLKIIPFTILTSVFAGVISIFGVVFTFYFNTTNSFSTTMLQKDKENKINPGDVLYNNIEVGLQLASIIILFSIFTLVIMFVIWLVITTKSKKYYEQQRGFKLLLDEVMEELKEEVKG